MEYDGIEELTELENVEEMKGKVKAPNRGYKP